MKILTIGGTVLMVLFTGCISMNSTIPETQIIETKIIAPSATAQVIPTATDTILPPNPSLSAEYVETIENLEETPELNENTSVIQSKGSYILIDHTTVEKFFLIPDDVIAQAAKINVLMRHASIGDNIRYGLDCIYGNYPDRRPNSCGPFFDIKYDSHLWDFQFRGNPGWIEKVDDFVRETNAQINQFYVFMFLLTYGDGLDNPSFPEISDPENFQNLYLDKLENLELQHPDKKFVWWTTSLAQLGQENTTNFNNMLRQYAKDNGKMLVDLADIETHDPKGNPCFDTNQIPVICSNYTNEIVSGHLNEVGRERMAKAFWYLMARLTGWIEA